MLALSVSDSFFINPHGPAVVWTPAVPGQLQNCEARGNASASAKFFASCDHLAGGRGLELSSINETAFDRLNNNPENILQLITAVPTDDSPVEIAGAAGKGLAPMAHLHVHVPPEAYNIAVVLEEVCQLGRISLWLPFLGHTSFAIL